MNLEEKIKELILKHVDGSGIKGVTLSTAVIPDLYRSVDPSKIPEDVSERYLEIIRRMVLEGEICEIEYTLPNMPSRIKSFYLPKGSKIVSESI